MNVVVNLEKKPKRRFLPKSLNEVKTQIALGTLTDEDKVKLARSKKTPSDVLEILSVSLCESTWEEIQKIEAIACNLNTSPKVLEALYNLQAPIVRALKNPNFPAGLLQEVCNKIIYDSTYETHYEAIFTAIENPTLPVDILKRLSYHPNIVVKDMVAQHPNASPATLEALSAITLSSHSTFSGCNPPRSVALNRATPAHVLTNLAKSKSSTIRRAVASNLSTPISILKELTTKSKAIRCAALNTLYILGKIKII
jgi:hypothetical protein